MKDQKFIDKNQKVMILFSVFILFCFNILFNGWICAGHRVFYLDDLGTVDGYLNLNFFQFIFAIGANKIRPISQLFIWLCLKLSENNYEIIDEALLLINFVNSIIVFSFSYTVLHKVGSVCKIIASTVCAMLYIASHFAYYNISEVLGIMEGIALALALGTLLMLFEYLEKGNKKYFYSASVLYALLIYTHERYFVLFFLFIFVWICEGKLQLSEKLKLIVIPTVVFVSFWIIRISLFGDRVVDGTGGTDINETFNIATAIQYCLSQIGYILGLNCGPQYLNGLEAKQVPKSINILLGFNILFVLGILLVYIRLLIKNKSFRQENLKKVMLFMIFIGLCIACSSITIRVEMRWIYVSYAAYLILLFYMISGLLEHYTLNYKRLAIVSVYIISVMITEQYYRAHYENIYYWKTKDMARELYDATIPTYGDSLSNKELVIVSETKFWENSASWTLENWKNFYSPYIDAENLAITYVDNLDDVSELPDNEGRVILVEDEMIKRYIDVTELFRPVVNIPTINYIYGCYEDHWIDMDCKFEIKAKENEIAELVFYYPEDLELKGENRVQIYVNEQLQKEISLTGSLTNEKIQIQPDSLNTVQIVSYGWVHENTGRSEDGRLVSTLQVNLE